MQVSQAERIVRAGAEGAWPGSGRVSLYGTVALAFGLLLLVGLFHVWSRTVLVEAGYAISQERARRGQLEEEQRQLKLQLRRLSDPARLDAIAQQAGLHNPGPGQIFILGK